MLIEYKSYKPRGNSKDLIAFAQTAVAEYLEQGLTLTVRQLYYQYIAHDILPNTENSYDKIVRLMKNSRDGGLIRWDGIEDRTRHFNRQFINYDPNYALGGFASQLAYNMWRPQGIYIECWIEKDALINTIEGTCSDYRVPYMACKGNQSASHLWRAGQRYQRAVSDGLYPILLHLGDHDPSGMDMTRDNRERLELYTGCKVEVRRLALNMDQIDKYAPPPNPAKEPDRNSKAYVAQFGTSSWELDALNPTIIGGLVTSELQSLIDPGIWRETLQREAEARAPLEFLQNHPQLALEWAERQINTGA